MQELLNGNVWTIETFGIDVTGERRLATTKINGEDVGDILIREGLARRWPDGPESGASRIVNTQYEPTDRDAMSSVRRPARPTLNYLCSAGPLNLLAGGSSWQQCSKVKRRM